MRARGANVDSILDDLTEVLVERFHPDSVILFGSRARGDARDDSDYDLAVVVDRERKRELRMAMEAAAREATGASVDIHLRRPGDIEDFATIDICLVAPEVPWTSIVFHAQQAAEKYLLAAIIARGVRPQRTHSLVELFDHLMALDPSIPDLRAECELLTPFAVGTRYPDNEAEEEAPADVDAETGERAVAAMRAIVAAATTTARGKH